MTTSIAPRPSSPPSSSSSSSPSPSPSGSSSLAPWLRARRVAQWGLVRWGWARVLALRGDVDALPPAERAQALLLTADVLRRASQLRAAADVCAAAVVAAKDAKQRSLAAGALLLAVDGCVAAGDLDAAAAFVKDADLAADARDGAGAADAALHLARGHVQDARLKLKSVPDDVVDPFTRRLIDLLRTETLLEMGALVGAEQQLVRLEAAMAGVGGVGVVDNHDEARLRLLLLRAAYEIAALRAKHRGAVVAVDEARVATASVDRAAGFAVAFPLHKAHAIHLHGELDLAVGRDPRLSFERAAAVLEAARLPFARASLIAKQAQVARAVDEQRTGLRLGPARALLVDKGAAARLGTVAKPAASAEPQRRSIAMRLEAALDDPALGDGQGLEAVIEVSRYLASLRNLDELFDKTLESIVRVTRAERGALLKKNDDGSWVCLAARGMKREDVSEGNVGAAAITFSVVREAVDSGEAVLSDNALADDRFKERQSVVATDIRSVLCSPVRTRSRTLGYVYLDRRLISVSFRVEQQDLLAAICTQVAVAWENALAFSEIDALNGGLEKKVKERTLELRDSNDKLTASIEELTNTRLKLAEAQRDALEKEMGLARDIQRSILPPEDVKSADGLTFVGRVWPASFCGGDWWSTAPLPGGRTLFVVADVTGHGVAASLITAVANACLDTLAVLGKGAVGEVMQRGPASTLAVLNDVVHAATGGQLCATAFAVVVDPATRSLTYSSAGHNPPYLWSRTKKAAVPLVARGSRLGESETSTYTEAVATYEAGDRLVLYTDGIVEWPGPKDRQFGDRRFRKAIEARGDVDVVAAADGVLKDATDFAEGRERDDDLTLVVIDLH